MIVLNTIEQGNVHRLLIDDYYDYLQLLKDNGVGSDLVDYFYNLYTRITNSIIK